MKDTRCENTTTSADGSQTSALSSEETTPSSSESFSTDSTTSTPSASPLEILTIRTVLRDSTTARGMAKRLEHYLMASKSRSPEFPGWYVGWNVLCTNCTVTVVFHVEPEADLPQV